MLQFQYISIAQLSPMTNQPRQNFAQAELQELKNSIQQYGILQPLVVIVQSEHSFKIVAGERRWRAAKLANMDTVPCIISEHIDESQLEVALIENIHRQDLNPLEMAQSFQVLLKQYKYTHEDLANRINKERSFITHSLRLLDLSSMVQEAIKKQTISFGHAKVLCSVQNLEAQNKILNRITLDDLSVRQTEQIVREYKNNLDTKTKKTLGSTKESDNKYGYYSNASLAKLCDDIKEVLGTKVAIEGDVSKGKIVVDYYSQEDLERVYQFLINKDI
jgi:ParB family transcriptional regulator, chromosome partitioning protein